MAGAIPLSGQEKGILFPGIMTTAGRRWNVGEDAGGWVDAGWEDSKSSHDDSVFLVR